MDFFLRKSTCTRSPGDECRNALFRCVATDLRKSVDGCVVVVEEALMGKFLTDDLGHHCSCLLVTFISRARGCE
ncbi:unnamed protein product [Vitrella brassicaformis CCMP3155]|uniref:Uncharacterized protein n=1 Tax=Vitrella brassicaformis (strain CCMP3155) TaxID=1169540 RepID=A0A0G4H535_VITBC|nr:unnamed protein product [Vitrella brassicaformis CCMP3155]|eukprot:CEM38678.1 unnamed protein product [Vitrella brassicaformis CCMP3155]